MEDQLLMFGEDASLALAVGDHDLTSVLDLGSGYDEFGNAKVPDYGLGGRPWLNINITTACASAGSATLKFSLQHCDTEGGTYVAVLTSREFALSELVAGFAAVRWKLPAGLKEFVKIVATVGTAALTAGKCTARITMDAESDK